MKKGMSKESVVWAVFFVAVLFVFLSFIFNYSTFLDRRVEGETCRKSVSDQAFVKQKLTVRGSDLTDYMGAKVSLKCPTHYYEITDKNDKAIMKKVADEMVTCWDNFGRGDLEIFDTEDHTFCVVCSRLEFKEDKTIDDWGRYQAEEVTLVAVGNNQNIETTYLEFLRGETHTTDDLQYLEDVGFMDMKLDTSEPLAIMVIAEKDAYPDSIFGGSVEAGQLETTTIGAATGTLAGLVLAGVFVVATGGVALPVIGVIGGSALVVGGGSLAGTIVGGTGGYFVGSPTSSVYTSNPKILIYPYNQLSDLSCTFLEGDSGELQVVEKI